MATLGVSRFEEIAPLMMKVETRKCDEVKLGGVQMSAIKSTFQIAPNCCSATSLPATLLLHNTPAVSGYWQASAS